MEDLNEEQIGPQMVTVPAIEIIRKLKTKIDRQNFCRENNWYIPINEPGYDTNFVLQVIKGEKKCLPLGFGTGFHLPSFRTGETLNKKYIIDKMMGNPAYGDYIPNKIQPMALSRDYLLSLVAFLDADLYRKLYIISKEELGKRNISKWKDYEMTLNIEILNKLKNFHPIEDTSTKSKPFRLSKNGEKIGIFNHIEHGPQNIAENNNRVIRINIQNNS